MKKISFILGTALGLIIIALAHTCFLLALRFENSNVTSLYRHFFFLMYVPLAYLCMEFGGELTKRIFFRGGLDGIKKEEKKDS